MRLWIGMIFLSSKEFERFTKIEETSCVYQSDESHPICGIPTDCGLSMPFEMPVMPLCITHAYEFRDWTMENTIEQIASILMEPEFLDKLRRVEDDDI